MTSQDTTTRPFNHSFDLTKRLKPPSSSPPITYLPPARSCFPDLDRIAEFAKSNPSVPARLVLPSLLSPIIYLPTAATPELLIPFLHRLLALLRTLPTLTAVASFPLALFPRGTAITRWLERLFDGVISLDPFSHSFSANAEVADSTSTSKSQTEEALQGLLRLRKLPIVTERGTGTGKSDDMAFAFSRKRLIIKPFNLPPLDAGPEDTGEEATKQKQLQF
jgi:elongator complex protein 4